MMIISDRPQMEVFHGVIILFAKENNTGACTETVSHNFNHK